MASPMVITYEFLVGLVLLLLQTQDAGSFVPLLAVFTRVEHHNAAAPSEQCSCVRRIPPITSDQLGRRGIIILIFHKMVTCVMTTWSILLDGVMACDWQS